MVGRRNSTLALGPSLGRPRPANADSRHPQLTAPTPLWPGLLESICDTGTTMPKPGDLAFVKVVRWS